MYVFGIFANNCSVCTLSYLLVNAVCIISLIGHVYLLKQLHHLLNISKAF